MKEPAASEHPKSTKSSRRKKLPDPATISGGALWAASSNDIQARIAVMAYELYRQRGGCDGNDVADWLAAERRILKEEQAGGVDGLP